MNLTDDEKLIFELQFGAAKGGDWHDLSSFSETYKALRGRAFPADELLKNFEPEIIEKGVRQNGEKRLVHWALLLEILRRFDLAVAQIFQKRLKHEGRLNPKTKKRGRRNEPLPTSKRNYRF